MNFRRQPFQFTAIDPAKRQAELQKRFGLPSNNSDMYVDYLNPGIMGAQMKEPSLSNASPRLQHRVPIFTEKADKVNPEQNNVDGGHKPRVRVVPIQVEGVDGAKRHRTFSGPAGMVDGAHDIPRGGLQETFPNLDATRVEDKIKKSNQPRVCNIPIHIEGREEKPKVVEKPKVTPNPKTPEPAKKLKTEPNGCAASKEQKVEPDKSVPLKQIENVLNKLQEYKEQVEKFTGTAKDKQYRYLDEMLTRCMLDLDNVDTMGLDEIRKARKEAVRQVQKYVDLLDTKVNSDVEKMESDTASVDNSAGVSEDGQIACENTVEDPKTSDIPTEANNAAGTVVNELPESSTTEDVEMSGDVTADDTKETVTEDIEMDDEKATSDPLPEADTEKMEVSGQDGEQIDSAVTDSTSNQEQNADKSPDLDTTPTSNNNVDSEINECENKSGVIIEELDSIDNESNVSASELGENENVTCIVSQSPELGVKEAIAEEGDSEIVIEEVEDNTSDSKVLKDINHSIDISDISVNGQSDKEKLTVEQLNTESESSSVTSSELPDTSVVQETMESEK